MLTRIFKSLMSITFNIIIFMLSTNKNQVKYIFKILTMKDKKINLHANLVKKNIYVNF